MSVISYVFLNTSEQHKNGSLNHAVFTYLTNQANTLIQMRVWS